MFSNFSISGLNCFIFFSDLPFRNFSGNLLLFVVVWNNSLWLCEIAFEPTLNATRAKCAFYDLHSLIRLLYAIQKFIYYFLCVLSAHTQAACSECTKRKFIIEQKFIYLQLNLFAYIKKNDATTIHVYIPSVLIIEMNISLNAAART